VEITLSTIIMETPDDEVRREEMDLYILMDVARGKSLGESREKGRMLHLVPLSHQSDKITIRISWRLSWSNVHRTLRGS